MRWLIPAIALTGCQTPREVVLPSGARYSDMGHLAGNTAIVLKPDGTFVAYNKMNQPWQDFMQTIAGIAMTRSGASVGRAAVRSREATRLGAQRAGVDRARLANDLEKLRLAADLERFRLLNPAPLPAGPP